MLYNCLLLGLLLHLSHLTACPPSSGLFARSDVRGPDLPVAALPHVPARLPWKPPTYAPAVLGLPPPAAPPSPGLDFAAATNAASRCRVDSPIVDGRPPLPPCCPDMLNSCCTTKLAQQAAACACTHSGLATYNPRGTVPKSKDMYYICRHAYWLAAGCIYGSMVSVHFQAAHVQQQRAT